ncbi:MoaD/ThiS family protein [Fusibacter bizertensis]
MTERAKNTIEVRGFLQLDAFLRKRYGKPPVILEFHMPSTGYELADYFMIPLSEIEVIFVNGLVQSLDFIINPGDRVAFLPPGCPGPYRIALGFYGKNQHNEANFKLKK